MKGDTPLDYAEFQLTTARTRCELFVSAEGVTEKLASGFLKPFLTHLRAAEEQIRRGFRTIRLERHLDLTKLNYRNWFTKGTLERFVRFVSTPEVLERVKTIEDELVQLEQVRNIQTGCLAQAEDGFLGDVDTTLSTADGKAVNVMYRERNGVPFVSRRYPFAATDDGVDASKRELLRAMDMRMLALQQEQSMFFARAAAAGFDRDNMADLIAFAEHFGADRLGEACMQFIAVSRKRQILGPEPEEMEATSSGSDMSLASGIGADSAGGAEVISHVKPRNSCENWIDSQNPRYLEETETSANEVVRIEVQKREGVVIDNFSIKDGSNVDLQRWEPHERFPAGFCHSRGAHPLDGSEKGTGIDSIGETSLYYTYPVEQCYSNVDAPRSEKLQDFAFKSGSNIQVDSDDCLYHLVRNVQTKGQVNEPNLSLTSPASPLHRQPGNNYSEDSKLKHAGQTQSQSPQKTNLLKETECFISFRDQNNFQPLTAQILQPAGRISHGAFKDRQAENVEFVKGDGLAKVEDKSLKEDLRGHLFSASSGFSLSGEVPSKSNTDVPDASSTCQDLPPTSEGDTPSQLVLADHMIHSHSSPDTQVKTQVDIIKNLPQKSSSPKRRPGSPLRRVHIGRSGVRRPGSAVTRSIDYISSHEHSTTNRGSTKVSDSSDCEDDLKNGNPDESRPGRRLSVQDAISLFENKQRDLSEAPIRRPNAQENCHINGDPSTSGKAVLRRWSIANDAISEVNRQWHKVSKVERQIVKPQSDDVNHVYSENTHSSTKDPQSAKVGCQLQPKVDQRETEISRVLADRNLPHSSRSFRQQLQPISTSGTPIPLETASNRQCSTKQRQSVESEASRMLEGELQQQFKMELAKSIKRETKNSNPATMTVPSVTEFSCEEFGSSIQEQPTENNSINLVNAYSVSDSQAFFNGDTGLEPQENCNSKQNLQSMLCSSVVSTSYSTLQEHPNAGWRNMKQPEPETLDFNERDFASSKEQTNTENAAKDSTSIRAEQITGGEAFASSGNASFECDMQALVDMADKKHHESAGNGDNGSPRGQRGRFYEQYMKLRDAKLREENGFKRAEREAKLKAMEETLEIRRAELEERNARLNKDDSLAKAHLRGDKFHAVKVDLFLIKKEQEETQEEDGMDGDEYIAQTKDLNITYGSPTSESSRSHARKDRFPTSNLHVANKKTLQSTHKYATARSSTRAAASSSPRSTPKNKVSRWRSAVSNQAGILDNPLARSVPCFTDLRKENTKPSPADIPVSSQQHIKNISYSVHPRSVNEASPLEINGSKSVYRAVPPTTGKEGRKRRSMLTRKSCANVSELKALSVQGQEGTVLTPVKVQRDGTTEPGIYSKVRHSAVAPVQEVKPFLRKGRGIGPGAGPGFLKQKVIATTDAARSSDEETLAIASVNSVAIDSEDHRREERPGTGDLVNTYNIDESNGVLCSEAHASSNFEVRSISDGQLSCMPHLPDKEVIVMSDGDSGIDSVNEVTCDTVSPPIDSQVQNYKIPFVGDPGSLSECSLPVISLVKQEDVVATAPLSQFLAENVIEPEQCEDSFVTASSSFRASSLPPECVTTPFSPAVVSPSTSSVNRPGRISDHFSPPSVSTFDSPLGSPASWNSTHIQYASEADSTHSRKKWGGSKKPVLIISQVQKEPAKGLKRLLKFGRKSRTSETGTTGWISASTTSEGDDETEEPKDLWSGCAYDFGNTTLSCKQYGSQYQVQSLSNSTPTPPADFKLREDHLSGGTLLRGPRSFFSLSSFRGKGSDGKSR